jgi:hypothetical protein
MRIRSLWSDQMLAAMSMGESTPAEECGQCEVSKLQRMVALRTSYYLTLHIRELALREAVLDHVTAAWALCVRYGGAAGRFEEFFLAYCVDVERDVDLTLRATDHAAEYRRAWVNHALTLRAENHLILSRSNAAAN